MSFPKYEKYRDSGVEWLGEVPEHWEVTNARRMFLQKREPSLPSDEQLSATQRYGVLPQRLFMEQEDHKVVLALSGLEGFKHVEADDFVISLRSFQGGIEHSQYSGCVSPAYTILRAAKPISPGYWSRLLKSSGYVSALQSVTDSLRDGKKISYEQFGLIPLPLVPLEEQSTIAAFLDHETAKIDALVEEQRRLIELLKEKRQAVISHAVTKGLNPDAPMKDSGVEWLGEVPEHWEVKRLRHAALLNPSKSEVSDYPVDQAVSFIPMEAIGEDGTLSLDHTRELNTVLSGYTYFRENDVTIAKITPCFENGKGAIMRGLLNGIGFGTTELIVARPHPEHLTSKYIAYIFQSAEFRALGAGEMYGAGGQKRVPDSFVREFECGLPPIAEQSAIAAFLEMETARLDGLVSEAESVITLLQERRTALISAAVTGKIDVRNHAPTSEGVPA